MDEKEIETFVELKFFPPFQERGYLDRVPVEALRIYLIQQNILCVRDDSEYIYARFCNMVAWDISGISMKTDPDEIPVVLANYMNTTLWNKFKSALVEYYKNEKRA